MRTEVIQADTVDAAAEQILHELIREETSTRSIRNRENVIYFDGWDGLGASAVLRAVAQRLSAPMASSSESPPAAQALRFDDIIYIDCSNWESRRALQRAIVEQLVLPAEVTEMLDRQDEEDDFHGVPQGSRNEMPEVVDATYQHMQAMSGRFLVIFQNGSSQEMDLIITTFGFPMYANSRNKLLWTFQGSLRLYPRMKVESALKGTVAATDVFLSATRRNQDPLELWRYLVRQEAVQVARRSRSRNAAAAAAGSLLEQPALVSECFFYTLKQCCMGSQFFDFSTHCSNYWICDGIIQQQGQGYAGDDYCGVWRAADALHREMRLDVDYHLHDRQYYLSHSVKYAEAIPSWSSPSYHVAQMLGDDDRIIANGRIFQLYHKLSVLKLSNCSFSFSSPPFLCCHSLRFLWLDHCQDSSRVTTSKEEEEEEEMRHCFQKLWVLDVRYTPCEYWILSPQMLDLMTELRELNVVGAQDWDIGQLHGRLPNICTLRVTKSIVRCSGHSEDDLFSSMNKLELLDFSGNRATRQGDVTEKLFGISTSSNQLETMVIIDGCVGIIGIQNVSSTGCAKLKNLLLSGLFEDLRILDLSGTAVKTLDLSAMTARNLIELSLDNCDKLCAILWPAEDKRNKSLEKLHVDTTTQSASTSRDREEKMKAGSTAAAGSSSSSWPIVLVNGARPPSEFNWCVSIKDARLLRSIVPTFGNYFKDHYVHLEISSPRCYPTIDVSGGENEGIKKETGEEPQEVLSNRQRQQPQRNNDSASMYYTDVATIIVAEHLLHGGQENGNDAPTITRTRSCPPPNRRLNSTDCYLYTHDQQMKTRATMDGGAITTVPSIICDHTYILHVHDSLYNTSIPGSAQWNTVTWCRVERCPRLDFIFTAPPLGGESRVRICYCLRTFWASQLPRTRFLWDTSKLSLSQIEGRSFEDLILLHLDLCPRLIHVLPFSSSVIIQRLLETIEIVWCGDLRVVFPLLDTDTESHQKQQQQLNKKPPGAIKITSVDFPNLKHIHLHELPMLESICGPGGRMYAPQLETIKVRGCWSLRHLPAVSSDRSSNKVECDGEKEWWDRLEWNGMDGQHEPCLYKPIHPRYYKKKLLRGPVLR